MVELIKNFILTELVSSFSNVEAAAEDAELLQGLWPSPAVALGAAVSLVIIFLLLTYFLYFPVKENIEKRQTKIDDEMKNATKLNEDAFKLSKSIDEEKRDFDKNKSEMFETSKKEADDLKKQIINQANDKAKRIIDNLQLEIAKTKEEASKDIEKEISVLAIMIAEKIISGNMSEEENEKLIQESLKEIKNKIQKSDEDIELETNDK